MSKAGDVYTEETLALPLSIEPNGVVYEDRYKKIEKITAKFEHFSKEYFVADFGAKAAVLVVRGECILLARQYRLFINGLSYEIPGGKVNEGEAPMAAAVRECLEETGVECRDLKPLIEYDPDLEYTRNHTHVFYAREMGGVQNTSTGKYVWLPVDVCLQMVYEGKIIDSLSIIAIFAYQMKKRTSLLGGDYCKNGG